MGHCFATHPLEMPRNFSKISHITIACGLIVVSRRVVQSWHPQDIKLSYQAVWVVYSNTFVLYGIIWNTLTLMPLEYSLLHCFHMAGCKMAAGNMSPPPVSCYRVRLSFCRTALRVGIRSFASVTSSCLWHCDTTPINNITAWTISWLHVLWMRGCHLKSFTSPS